MTHDFADGPLQACRDDYCEAESRRLSPPCPMTTPHTKPIPPPPNPPPLHIEVIPRPPGTMRVHVFVCIAVLLALVLAVVGLVARDIVALRDVAPQPTIVNLQSSIANLQARVEDLEDDLAFKNGLYE